MAVNKVTFNARLIIIWTNTISLRHFSSQRIDSRDRPIHRSTDIIDPPIYRSTDIIGRYLILWISADTQISTDILVCLSTTQFAPKSSRLSKNLQILLKFFLTKFFMPCQLPILFANKFHVLFCIFCLDKLVYAN